MDFASPRTSRVGIPTGPKGVGVEIRAESGPAMSCVERLFPRSPRGGGSWFLNPRAVVLPPPMTFSQAQAARVRKALAGRKEITEKEMFGGVALLLGGDMGVWGYRGELLVRSEASADQTR